MIKISNLSFAYNSQDQMLFKNLNLEFEMGKKYLITGSNGSGKSTLLKLIAQLEKPIRGSITYLKQKNFTAPNCSFFSQDLGLFPQFTVKEHLELFSQIIPNKRAAHELADKFDLSLVINQAANEISKGQQAKLGLCLALYFNPQIILLDEPSNALDSKSIDTLFQELQTIWNYHNSQCLVIVVTHQADLFKEYCDSFVNIEEQILKNKLLCI